eukprot:CAMPEP_0180492848 /NCGR_PEP_ID=MMETSP1036_2-20121128/40403_1 /TAXON_ID=632150 /ORGANISM="Azadinium spinosum, Strain 3D9" /LENGTH=117 /DNA_ID=CAMNT_0022501207 /DNA_START=89 /DNA_END=439 /DNA_ORIENTATION=-
MADGSAPPKVQRDATIEGQAHQPALCEGRMRNQGRLLPQAGVHLYHLTVHGALHLAHSLQSLQGGDGVHDLEARTKTRQAAEDHLSEGVLRQARDAHRTHAFAFDLEPFVGLCEIPP